MKRFLVGLATLPFLASIASAAEPLTNQQMDRVTGGGALPTVSAIGPSVIIGTNPAAGVFSGLQSKVDPPAPASDPPASDPPASDPPAAGTTGVSGQATDNPNGYAANNGSY